MSATYFQMAYEKEHTHIYIDMDKAIWLNINNFDRSKEKARQIKQMLNEEIEISNQISSNN